jgi:ligand-binding SRPBCC domain-containing protein
MRFTFHSEQWVPHPIDLVFDFFADPANLPLLMPPAQKARIEKTQIVPPPPRPRPASILAATAAGAGSQVVLSFQPIPLLPLRIKWTSEIAAFAWDDHFCDRQIQGPFAYWNHCHRLQAVDGRGLPVTLIADEVEYELPMGALGKLAHRLFLRQIIEGGFAFRHKQLEARLALATSPSRQQQSTELEPS